MKKCFMFFALIVALTTVASAQQMPDVPLDPQVRTGKLANGLTYYIRHNEWPEQRADFYIAQKVGSMQEEDNQRGLAHFLEHMCFNGTTHFPGNGLISYLETIGVKFGADLNAGTGFDQTVYNINNVPVITVPSAIDSCLMILHDWSHDLLLTDKDIDDERGVINEEWRVRSDAQMRIYEQALPLLYEGSKYANRLPIGTMDVVLNFKYQTLRDYYHKWYRPDLQAVVVVGDVDVDQIEQKIKAIFADIPAPVNPAERVYFPVQKNREPIVAVAKDKEMPQSSVRMMWKQNVIPAETKKTMAYIIVDYVKDAIASMLNERINEIIQKPNAPFVNGGAGYTEYMVSKTMDSFVGIAMFKDNGHKEAIKGIYREILRAHRFGFTESEYLRFREEYKSQLDNQYEKRDKIPNTSHAKALCALFTDDEPVTGIEWRHTTMPMLIDQLPLAIVNQGFQSDSLNQNLAILLTLPDKDGIVTPTKEEIIQAMKEVEAENIEAYTEEVSTEPLVDITTLKGSKVKKQTAGPWDSQHITLSNGIEIYVKKTDYQPNSIRFSATSWGGYSLYPSDDEFLKCNFTNNMSIGGWGDFSATELQKKLAGHQASCNPSVGSRSEGLSGSCVTKDLEYLLQLIYLQFTAPRKDLDAYTSFIERTKTHIQNQELQPTTALQDSIYSVYYKNNIRARRSHLEDLERLDYDRSIAIYKERFANAADFKFFFTGDIDLETALPLIERYIGSLPVSKKKETYKPGLLKTTKGENICVFQNKQETPMAYCVFVRSAEMTENLKNTIVLSMLEQIMDIVYTKTVREDEGGSYSVSVNSVISTYPEKQATLQVVLPTAPAKREKMEGIILDGMRQMAAEGPSAENLQKVREYMLRRYDEQIKTNGFWHGSIIDKVTEDKDFVTGYADVVNSVTAADIQQMAKTIFQSGNSTLISMTDDTPQPEK
ncbi:MAG: insulinase family protein [Bacteroidaceae bacterium]|nr:insulinase family protein [Bacteroidaceae bacterium]